MRKRKSGAICLPVLLFCLCAVSISASAQFEFSIQMLQRTEFRHGYGHLLNEQGEPAAFVGYRARLQFDYRVKKLRLYASLQDVRIFGSTPQVKFSDPFLSVHEAFAEIQIDTSWTVKIGRQELNYDNFRFLGNLDWALQARAHDFALVKYEKGALKIHAGGGYNQDAERLEGTLFTTGNQYKTAQMARVELTVRDFHFSFLFWNDGRQYTIKDTLDVIQEKGVRFRQTIGLPAIRYKFRNTTISAFYYHQLGEDIKGRTLNAFDACLFVSQRFVFNEEKKKGLTATLGAEALSGNSTNSTGNTNHAYAPLYGTNHIHNGYMDLFYVGGRHENSTGLYDLFLRLRYDVTSKLFCSLNTHYFNSYASVYDASNEKLSSYLGTELDFTFGYVAFSAFSIQAGYSQLFQGKALETLQKVNSTKPVQNWAYVMLIYRPHSDRKFVGLIH